jgi:hypothetical protein
MVSNDTASALTTDHAIAGTRKEVEMRNYATQDKSKEEV